MALGAAETMYMIMRTSVIMPYFNAALHLPHSFNSVLGQTYSHLELIAVDDSSHDGTLVWLQAQTDPRVRVISRPNCGVSAARNAGLAILLGRLGEEQSILPATLTCPLPQLVLMKSRIGFNTLILKWLRKIFRARLLRAHQIPVAAECSLL